MPNKPVAHSSYFESAQTDRFDDEEGDIELVHERSPEQHSDIVTPENDKIRRRMMEEERIREIYGPDTPFTPCPPVRPSLSQRDSSRSVEQGDSLPDLLVAAFKIAMRDKKNVAICFLSILVLILALRPGSNANSPSIPFHTAPEIMMSAKRATEETVVPAVAEASVKVSEVTSGSATETLIIEVETVKRQPVETPVQRGSPPADTLPVETLVDSPRQILQNPEAAQQAPGTIVDPASENIEKVEEKEPEIPI